MKHSPVELASELLRLQLLIGSTIKCLDMPDWVRTNLVSLSIGLSKISCIAFDFEGEPTEGVQNG